VESFASQPELETRPEAPAPRSDGRPRAHRQDPSEVCQALAVIKVGNLAEAPSCAGVNPARRRRRRVRFRCGISPAPVSRLTLRVGVSSPFSTVQGSRVVTTRRTRIVTRKSLQALVGALDEAFFRGLLSSPRRASGTAPLADQNALLEYSIPEDGEFHVLRRKLFAVREDEHVFQAPAYEESCRLEFPQDRRLCSHPSRSSDFALASGLFQ